MRRLSFSLGLGGIAFVFSTQLGACNVVPDTCETYATCPAPAGSSGSSGAATAGTEGDSGAHNGGTAQGGYAGSSTTAGSAGDAAAGNSGEAGAGGTASEPCDGLCTGAKPICDEPADACVECLKAQDCTSATKKKCDATQCVECTEAADCSSAAASRCQDHACAKCQTNDDCKHIAGKGVCDDGTCVACTVADESACSGKSCDPATKTCTNTTLGSIGTCKVCVSDSECIGGNKTDPDARCVPMQFEGAPREGGFCLRRVAKTCARPFKTPFSAVSLSGAQSEAYCGIDQDNVRCEAVLDLINAATCSDGQASSCGCARDNDGNCIDAGAGGLCETVGVDAKRCTYACGLADQCPTGTNCTIDDPYCH